MKIAFDENIPPVMVKVFKTLAVEGHVVQAEFVSAREYATPGVSGDVNWLNAFAKDGGKIVISGDKKMRARPHERQALMDAKFTVLFFAPKWNEEDGFAKAAFLIKWWPNLQKKIEESALAACWEIQLNWNVFKLRDVTGPTVSMTKNSIKTKKKAKLESVKEVA